MLPAPVGCHSHRVRYARAKRRRARERKLASGWQRPLLTVLSREFGSQFNVEWNVSRWGGRVTLRLPQNARLVEELCRQADTVFNLHGEGSFKLEML